jgi:hypothetical protein
MRIRTDYDPKPIPLRNFDWCAVDDQTYDGPGCPVGYGRTEQEAIDDLMMQVDVDPQADPACAIDDIRADLAAIMRGEAP